MAKIRSDDVVYDLGCGDGRIAITAIQMGAMRAIGIDLDPDTVTKAQNNSREAGVADRVSFIQGDLFSANISDATLVTLYLRPSANLELRPMLLGNLKPGTRVVSHKYNIGDWKPACMEQWNGKSLYLWVIAEGADLENYPRTKVTRNFDVRYQGIESHGLLLTSGASKHFSATLDQSRSGGAYPFARLNAQAETVSIAPEFSVVLVNGSPNCVSAVAIEWSFESFDARSRSATRAIFRAPGISLYEFGHERLFRLPTQDLGSPIRSGSEKLLVCPEAAQFCARRISECYWERMIVRLMGALFGGGEFVGIKSQPMIERPYYERERLVALDHLADTDT